MMEAPSKKREIKNSNFKFRHQSSTVFKITLSLSRAAFALVGKARPEILELSSPRKSNTLFFIIKYHNK